jgi:hypothetical protein
MGCDIHTRVEVFLPRVEGAPRWVMFDDDIFDTGWGEGRMTCEPFGDRNYTLFALLANVRNGYGFAGIVTGNPVTPLDEPRGVPSNASLGWLAEVDSWDVDMHSHTWFTLRELLEDNPLYDQPLIRRGVISGPEYEKIRDEGGRPDGWSGSISGAKIITVTVDAYNAGVRAESFSEDEIANMRAQWVGGGLARGESLDSIEGRLQKYLAQGRTYVEYIWEDSLRDSCKQFHDDILVLKAYADEHALAYDDVRVVMGFDN